MAEAGSIYLVRGEQLCFSYTQNEVLERKLPPGKKLIYTRFTLPINDRSVAGYVAHHGITINLPDVYQIGTNHPYRFDGELDKQSGYHTKSMLTLPIISSLGKVLGVVQLINARNQLNGGTRSFSQSDENLSQMFVKNIAVALNHLQITRSVVNKITTLLDARIAKNSIIVEKVAFCAAKLFEGVAVRRGLVAREIEYHTDLLRLAARLYDIGKLLLPSTWFMKGHDELTAFEKNGLKEHTWRGAALFDNEASDFAALAKVIALEHHEAWDGSGYPGMIDLATGEPLPGYAKPDGTAYGKRGEEINLDARIVAVADAYIGLLYADSNQVSYDTVKLSLRQLQAASKHKFDPQSVAELLNAIDEINAGLGIIT